MEEQRRQREGRAPEPKETKGQASVAQEPKYLLYIRLPIKRGDFVDPPLVCCTRSHCARLVNSLTDTGIDGLERREVERALEYHLR